MHLFFESKAICSFAYGFFFYTLFSIRGCIFMEQTLMDKLTILADSAKYDVACTSSGASRTARAGTVGSCYAPGCCHAFTADGRCVSLLKVLMTNCCSFDCSYCVNRKSNDLPRATFSPRELAELTMEFYRRNYIEGLFLSSAVLVSPDYTTERMLAVLRLLRGQYHFGGYIHAKAIPGTSPELLEQLGYSVPTYCHVPLLKSPAGRRLSKRDRDLDMGYLRAHTTPEKLVGLLAYLAGLIPQPTALRPSDLVPEFSWSKVGQADRIVDDGIWEAL